MNEIINTDTFKSKINNFKEIKKSINWIINCIFELYGGGKNEINRKIEKIKDNIMNVSMKQLA